MRIADLNEYSKTQGVKGYLACIDPAVLRRKILRYEKLSRMVRTRREINRDINEVILHRDSDGNGFAAIPTNTKIVAGGTKIFRARLIDHEDQISLLSDIWQAPPMFVSAGRLNVPREPLIYTSQESPATAAFEVRMKPGDVFAMIQYSTKLNVSYAPVGEVPMNLDFTMNEVRKLKMIYGFMEDIFTQRASPNKEHVYIAPELIVKNFFDWPIEISQAWGYRSVADPGGHGFNLCFRPEVAKAYLHFEEVTIGRCKQIDEGGVRFDTLKVMKQIQGTDALAVSS